MKKFEPKYSVVGVYLKTEGARPDDYIYVAGQFESIYDARAFAAMKANNDPALANADDYDMPDHFFVITPVGEEEIDPNDYEVLDRLEAGVYSV